MQPRATIVIPTYNGANRIGEVLDALAAQSADDGSFEVLVVDNRSTDGTAELVQGHPARARLSARAIECRVVSEPRQGLVFGRICGVREARAPYVCFLDDDNLPGRDYVREGTDTLDAHQDAGLLISRVRPRYEANPPPSMTRREHLLALNYRLGESPIDWGASATMAPTLGAGMWLRRASFLAAVPWERSELLMADRSANSFRAGTTSRSVF